MGNICLNLQDSTKQRLNTAHQDPTKFQKTAGQMGNIMAIPDSGDTREITVIRITTVQVPRSRTKH